MQYIELSKQYQEMYLVRYEDVVAREPRTVGLLCDLARITEQQFEQVLAVNLSGGAADISQVEQHQIMAICRSAMAALNYSL